MPALEVAVSIAGAKIPFFSKLSVAAIITADEVASRYLSEIVSLFVVSWLIVNSVFE